MTIGGIELENYRIKYKKILTSTDYGINNFKIIHIAPYDVLKTCVEIFYEYIDRKGVLKKGSSIREKDELMENNFMKDLVDNVAICDQIWKNFK